MVTKKTKTREKVKDFLDFSVCVYVFNREKYKKSCIVLIVTNQITNSLKIIFSKCRYNFRGLGLLKHEFCIKFALNFQSRTEF